MSDPRAPAPLPSAVRLLGILGIGSFVGSLTHSVVNVVLPRIGEWSGHGILDVQWVALVPLLVVSVALLPAGRAGDLWGHRRVYLAGLWLVAAGGLGCAVAPGFAWLLVARGLQGLGAALMTAAAPALISLLSVPGRRGRALGIVSTAIYLGLTFGPPLGGFLEAFGGFRAVFWIQVPLSLALIPISTMGLPEAPRHVRSRTLDPVGALLLGAGLTGLLMALARWEAWGGAAVLAAAAGVLALAGFVAWESRHEAPLVDLALFRDRTFASATVGAVLNYTAIFHATFLLPFHLVDVLGMSPARAGLFLMAMPLFMALVAGPSGALSDRLGSRGPSSAGLAVSAVALAGLAALPARVPDLALAAVMCLLGIGAGVFVSPNTNALMSSAPPARQGTAAGVMALSRNVGMLAGTALSAALFHAVRDGTAGAGAAPLDAGTAGFRAAAVTGALAAAAGALVVRIRPRA